MKFNVGDSAEITKRIEQADIDAFANVTGDHNPVHVDEEFAKTTRFGKRIAHGMLTASLISAVLANKSYRCKDNSLVYIDWFNDNQTANLHLKDKTATPVVLSAPKAGEAYVGSGYTLTGTATSKSVTLKKGGSGQDCDA